MTWIFLLLWIIPSVLKLISENLLSAVFVVLLLFLWIFTDKICFLLLISFPSDNACIFFVIGDGCHRLKNSSFVSCNSFISNDTNSRVYSAVNIFSGIASACHPISSMSRFSWLPCCLPEPTFFLVKDGEVRVHDKNKTSLSSGSMDKCLVLSCKLLFQQQLSSQKNQSRCQRLFSIFE